MKKFLIGIVAVAFLLSGVPAFAQKGANAKAYEHASDEAVFNRIGDWFATIGKTDEEKETIIAERKAKRATERAEKEAQKAKKEAEKKAEKAKKEAKERVKELEKKTKEQKEKMKKMMDK